MIEKEEIAIEFVLTELEWLLVQETLRRCLARPLKKGERGAVEKAKKQLSDALKESEPS